MASPPRKPEQPLTQEQLLLGELGKINRSLTEILGALKDINESLKHSSSQPR